MRCFLTPLLKIGLHTAAAKKIHPFASVWYEIGVVWPNIKPVKRHTTALHCKCFVCRNFRCLSAIQIQKQTLVNSIDIFVWLIKNVFMLFLSKFSCWIYWEIITLCWYYKYLSVILETIFHSFKTFSLFMLNMIIIC